MLRFSSQISAVPNPYTKRRLEKPKLQGSTTRALAVPGGSTADWAERMKLLPIRPAIAPEGPPQRSRGLSKRYSIKEDS